MLDDRREAMIDRSALDYSDLRALFVNCTLKRSPAVSNTQGLADLSIEIMKRNEVEVDTIRAIDQPGRDRRTSTRAPVVRRTTSRTATRRS